MLRPVTLTFDILTLKVVYESRVTWATSVPISVFLGLSVLDLGPMQATDRRQTSDAHHRLKTEAESPKGRRLLLKSVFIKQRFDGDSTAIPPHYERSTTCVMIVGLPVQAAALRLKLTRCRRAAAATVYPCPLVVTFTFDLLTLKVVSESRLPWATPVPILFFLGLASQFSTSARCTRQTDVRQTSDVSQKHRLMSPPIWGGGIINIRPRYDIRRPTSRPGCCTAP